MFDLASADVFSRQDIQVLTPLANTTAVAIETVLLTRRAPLPTSIASRRKLRFAHQEALLPQEAAAWRRRGALRGCPRAGGGTTTSSRPSRGLVVAVGDVSGKGARRALRGLRGELVRGRTAVGESSPAGCPRLDDTSSTSVSPRGSNHCTLCYASFDFERLLVTRPLRAAVSDSAAPRKVLLAVDCRGRRTFGTSAHPLRRGDVLARPG